MNSFIIGILNLKSNKQLVTVELHKPASPFPREAGATKHANTRLRGGCSTFRPLVAFDRGEPLRDIVAEMFAELGDVDGWP